MDPATGIAVVYGLQLAPPGDVEAYKVEIKLESTLYQGLITNATSHSRPCSL